MSVPLKKSVLGIGVSVTSYGEVLRVCAQWIEERRARRLSAASAVRGDTQRPLGDDRSSGFFLSRCPQRRGPGYVGWNASRLGIALAWCARPTAWSMAQT